MKFPQKYAQDGRILRFLPGYMHVLVFAFFGLTLAAFALGLVVIIAVLMITKLKQMEREDRE